MLNIKFDFKKLLLLLAIMLAIAVFVFILWRLFGPAPTDTTLTTDTGNLVIDPVTGLPISNLSDGGQVVTSGDDLPTAEDTITGATGDFLIDDLIETEVVRDNKISSATNHRVVDPTIGQDGSSVQYYNPLDGYFYRLNAQGEAELLSDQKFNQVRQVAWSPQQDKAVLYYPDGIKTIYDFQTDTQVTLPGYWDEFAWSPNGQQLAFKSLGYDAANRWLATMNSDGTGSQKIEKIGNNAEHVIVNWSPNNQIMATLDEGLDLNRKTVYLIGFNGENFKAITTQGRGFEYQWSPQGTTMLFSTYSDVNEYKPMLWRVDAQGDNIGNNLVPLGLETWSEKCTFTSNNEAYCAVPQTLERGAGLFPQTAKNTADDLYRVNLDSGTKVLLDSTSYNMQNLMVTSDQSSLYFTDSFTGRLHKIAL